MEPVKSPFLLTDADGPLSSDDAIVVRLGSGAEHEGTIWIELPQFLIQFCVQSQREVDDWASEALREIVGRVLTFRVALDELPADYITGVERAQSALIDDALAPWLVQMYGRHPEYLNLPSEMAGDLVPRDGLVDA